MAAPKDGAATAAGVRSGASAGSTPKRYGVVALYIGAMDRVSAATAVLAALLLLSGVFAVCHMIFVRYVLNHSTVWQTEFTVYAVTAAMLLGSPYVLQTGGHVAVTVLYDATTGIVRRLLRLAAALVGLAFCAALAFAAWRYTIEAYVAGWHTSSVWSPLVWPAVAPVAIGATLLSLQYVAEILRGES